MEPKVPNAISSFSVFEDFKTRSLALIIDDLGEVERAILVAAAQNITTSIVNEILHISSGPLFVALSPERVQAFMLSKMGRPRVTPAHATDINSQLNICLSVEAREGVTTGISVADRTATIKVLGEASPNARKLVKPGHIFPVEVREGGTLVKNALPEAALDLVKICGASEAAVFVDVLNESGDLIDIAAAGELAGRLSIPRLTLSDLMRYRLENEKLVFKVAEARLPTRLAGELKSCVYRTSLHEAEHFALVKGEIDPTKPVLTRVQTEHTCADVFGGLSTPSRKHLRDCLRAINQQGCGVFLYLRSPFAGILREQVSDPQADKVKKPMALMREYGIGAQILRDLGVRKIELLSSSNKVLSGISTFGIEIVAQKPLPSL